MVFPRQDRLLATLMHRPAVRQETLIQGSSDKTCGLIKKGLNVIDVQPFLFTSEINLKVVPEERLELS